jgi:hypothetical protein
MITLGELTQPLVEIVRKIIDDESAHDGSHFITKSEMQLII